MLGLLFRQESCEGDNLSIDLLLPDWALGVAVHIVYSVAYGRKTFTREGVRMGESRRQDSAYARTHNLGTEELFFGKELMISEVEKWIPGRRLVS